MAALAADPMAQSRALEDVEAKAGVVMKQAFVCMDAQTRVELNAHIADAAPTTIVDGALKSCSHLKRAYADALTSPDVPMSPSPKQMADDWFESLRQTYVKHINEFMTRPEIADLRSKTITLLWGKCVREKAADWSRLQDEAATVAQAAASACNGFKMNLQVALGYQLRGKKLPGSEASKIADKIQGEMQAIATEVVITERAKRLPKQ